MTVGDRIRTMTDREISDMLCTLMFNDCDSCPFKECCPRENYLDWIKSEWHEDYYDGGFYNKFIRSETCRSLRKTHKDMDTPTQI